VTGPEEFARLILAGVNVETARILAYPPLPCGDERGYWRHIARNETPDEFCRAAHAAAQRARRSS
jgi:hypothetical protein